MAELNGGTDEFEGGVVVIDNTTEDEFSGGKVVVDNTSSKKKVSAQPVSTPLENSGTGSVSVRPSTSATEPFDPSKFAAPPKQPVVRNPVNQYSEMQKEAVLSGQDYIAPQEMMGAVSAREYEKSQKELIGAQKGLEGALDADYNAKNSVYADVRSNAGKRSQDAAVLLGHAQFKADENISKLKDAIKPDLEYVGSNLENFTRKSQEEDVIADEVKIDKYAKEQARKKGLPEDGYYKNFLYNNAKAEVAQKIIEPDVLKEREKLFKEKTGKSIDAAFGEDFAKGFTKAQEIEQTAKTQVNLVAQEVNSLAKVETEEVAKGVNSQIEQLNAAYQQQASQVTDQAQADALHQEYTANFNKLQANFLDAQNQINGKYNQRLRRQADEIEKVATQKWAEEAEKYKKDYKASPELLAQLKDVSQEAYTKVVGGKEKIKEARDYSVPALNNYYRSTVSSLGRSLGNLSETVGYDYGKVLGDYMENTYQPGSAELNSWKDLLDASKLAKSAGQLTGAMLPSMTAAAATTIATEGMGAPAAVSMLAGGLAAWTGESMDMAGNIERETFAATGDANKALERSKRMWDAQMAIMPLYALEGLPFMKGLSISKNVGKRMVGGAVAEFIPETLQEYTQTKAEEVINKDKEFSQIFDTASWKEFGHTALNVAPVILLGAGGQIKGEASEKEKSETDAKKFAKTYALKEEFTEFAPDQRDQFLSTMIERKGVNFTSAFISNLYTNGHISKASANELTKSMGIALEVQNKAKEYGLDQSQQQVFTAFKYKLDAAQRRLAEETDPILKQVAEQRVKELEEQTVNFASGKQADYVVLTYPNNEQYVLSLSQAQNAAKNPKLIQSIQSGDMKVDGVGKGVDIVNGITEGIKAEKKAKVDAEKAGLVAETGAFIEDRIATQNANYDQKAKQDKEAAAIAPEAKVVELSPTITPKSEDVAGVPDEAIKADTRETKSAPAIQKPLEETEIGGDIKNNTGSKTVIPIAEIEKLRSQKQTDLATGNAIDLEKNLSKNGIKEPLVVTYYPNEGKAVLSDGHTRLDVAKDMGAENMPIRIVEKYTDAPNNAKDWTPPKAETQINEETKTPTQDTPTKSDFNDTDKRKSKGSVPTTQEPVRVDKKKGSKKRKGVRAAFPKELKGFEPTNLRDAIKIWILGGGRLNKTEFAKQITATHTQEYKESEWMRREDVKENSADLIAINQFEEWINSGLDEQSVINEIYDVAATYAHKNGIEQLRKELLESKDAKDYLEANGMSREDAAAMEAYYKEIDELEKAKQEYYSELTPEEVRLLNEAEPEMTDEIIRAIHAEEITQANIDTKLNQIQNENNDGTEKSAAESSTTETVGVSKAKKEYEAELADLTQKLKDAEKAKRDKLDRISGKVDLFADEAKSNELFGAEQNLSAENIAKQLQPETDKIAKLEAEKAAFEANKENYLKKYDKQSEIPEEKPLTDKEKSQKELSDAMAALRKKLGAGSGVQLQVLPEFIAAVKAAIKAGYYTAKEFIADFKESFPNHTEQEIEDAFNEVNKAEDLEKGMEEGEPKEKKKTVLTKRSYEGTIRDEVKKYLEKKGLTRESFSQEQRSKQAEQFINEFGEDAALLAVENGDIRGAMATSVIAKLIKRNDDAMSLLTAEDVEQLDVLGKKAAELIALLEKESFLSGEQVGQLAYEYENSDIGYNLEKKLADYKEQFGEVPADVKAKFEELDKQYKEVKSKLAEAEERVKKAEEELTIKNIQEANERKKKIEGNKPPRIKSLSDAEQKRRLELRGKYSGAFNDISRLVTLLAEKDFREYVGLVFKEAKGDFEYFAKQLVKEVGKGIKEHIEKLWSDNGGIVPEKEVGKPKVVDGKIVIPKDLIRNLVEGGIDNIEDLTKAVKEELVNDFPEITDREVRDAITDYGKTVNLNTEEIATQIRQMRRVGRILSALEDVAQKKRPMRSGMQRDKLDAQERALNKELREAMKELPVDAELEAAQQKTASDAAKQRLTNQIEDLQREIDKGERVPRNARTIKDDAELTALKAKRDAKKAEHEAIFKDEEYQQAKRLELTKANTQRRIEELQRRIKEGDFAPKKKTPLIADTELIKLQAEKLRIQEDYDREFYKASLLARTTGEKIKNALLDFWGLTRVLRATGEASFVGIQGLTQSVSHPKHAVEAMKTAISFLTSEKRTQDWLNKVKAQEWYPELKKSKLSLTEPHAEITAREELFYSDHVAMVWNLLGLPFKKISDKAYENFKAANPIKALERAAVGYLDTLRVMRFMDGKRLLEERGITFENNPQAYKDMADVVNTLTGRGSIGALEQNSKLLSQVFFSPRNWASAFKTATPYAFYWLGKKRAGAEGWKPSVAQKMAMADLLKVIGATSAVVMLAALKFNNDDDDETGVELDPRSSDFMKIRLGNKRIDPWGGRIQQVVFMSRMIAESAHYANPSLSEGGFKNTKGEVMPLGTPYKSPSAESVVINMAINKLSPSAALAQNFLAKIPQDDGTYKDEFGNPYKLSQDVKDNLYPIYWSTISEVVKDDPKALDGLLLTYAFFGGGVNVYDKKSKAKPFKSSDADVNSIINKAGYVTYKDKSGYNEKGDKVTITPEQVDAIAKRRDELVDKQLKKDVANLKKQSDSVKKSYVDDLKSEATAYAQYKVLGYVLSNEKSDETEKANSMLTMEQKRLPKNQKDALVNNIVKSIKAENEAKINYLKNKFEK